jgi:hypothetical protein
MKRKSSKFWPSHLLGGTNNIHGGSKAHDELNTALLIHQHFEADEKTIDLLLSLLMHLMANLARVLLHFFIWKL